jgi:hypothetical protein
MRLKASRAMTAVSLIASTILSASVVFAQAPFETAMIQ